MIDHLVGLSRRRRRLALLAASALALGACSSSASDAGTGGVPGAASSSLPASAAGPSPSGPSGGSEADGATPEHLFPSVDVVDVASGETLNLADELAGGDVPLLLWFWAPH